jgi:hypothetical protein
MLNISTRFDSLPFKQELAERLLDEKISCRSIRIWLGKEKNEFIGEQTLRSWRKKLIKFKKFQEVNDETIKGLYQNLLIVIEDHKELWEKAEDGEKRAEGKLLVELIGKAVHFAKGLPTGDDADKPNEMSDPLEIDRKQKDKVIAELESDLQGGETQAVSETES